jgi:hypothetical protein
MKEKRKVGKKEGRKRGKLPRSKKEGIKCRVMLQQLKLLILSLTEKLCKKF